MVEIADGEEKLQSNGIGTTLSVCLAFPDELSLNGIGLIVD